MLKITSAVNGEVVIKLSGRMDVENIAELETLGPLKREELDEVLDIELRQVQKRVLDSTTRPFLFRITSEGREFLLEEGTDQRYGARHLKRAIERYVVHPIARLLATAQVHQGDALVIDHHLGEEGLVFSRDKENRSSDFPLPNSGQRICATYSI